MLYYLEKEDMLPHICVPMLDLSTPRILGISRIAGPGEMPSLRLFAFWSRCPDLPGKDPGRVRGEVGDRPGPF